ncbi:MAG: CBS domain-containing protein [Candidatus Pacearchaeota archaeon]
MRVKDIMKKVVTIDRKDTIKHAASLMSKKNIGCLVVIEGNLIVGIITERDIIKHISYSNYINAPVEDIMTSHVITIDADASIDEAADSMFQHKIKKLPVIENGKLLGIITATDIIANSDSIDEPFLF